MNLPRCFNKNKRTIFTSFNRHISLSTARALFLMSIMLFRSFCALHEIRSLPKMIYKFIIFYKLVYPPFIFLFYGMKNQNYYCPCTTSDIQFLHVISVCIRIIVMYLYRVLSAKRAYYEY